MKPKARYDGQRRLWMVHTGDLRKGWAQGESLGEALAYYQQQLSMISRLPPGKLHRSAPSPIQLIQQLENVIETQKLEIAHCHAVCDELRQQLNQSRRSIWGLTPTSGPHWSGKQS